MRGTPRLLGVLGAMIVAAAPHAVGQAVARARTGPAWTPMGALAPVSLGAGERIVLGTTAWSTDRAQSYEVLEKLPAGTWASWSLRKLNHGCMAYAPPRLCAVTWGPVTRTWAPAVQVRALLDLVGGGPSEIYTYQEVGALAAPASVSPGMVRAVLQPGQALELVDHRILYQTPYYGWGATDLILYVGGIGGHQLGKWAHSMIVTDQSRRVAIVERVGVHRADNCGVPVATLAAAK